MADAFDAYARAPLTAEQEANGKRWLASIHRWEQENPEAADRLAEAGRRFWDHASSEAVPHG